MMSETKTYDSFFDKDEWRQERNRKLLEWTGDQDAVRMILDMSDICELIDDVVDKDKEISRQFAERVCFEIFVDLPLNQFYNRHIGTIIPVFNQGIHAWIAANNMEEDPTLHNLHRAFMLRNIYGRITHTVVEICRGRQYLLDHQMEIDNFFLAESLDEYKQKFAKIRQQKQSQDK